MYGFLYIVKIKLKIVYPGERLRDKVLNVFV